MQLNIEKIVIVDDYPDNLFVMKQVLKQAFEHAEIIAFEHSEDVMQYMLKTDVSVAIFDVQMPVLNGIDLCKMVKTNEFTKNTPVLLVTSHESSSRFKASGLDVGADDFLTRPMNNDELIARVNVALRTRRSEKELKNKANKVKQDYEMLFNKMLSGFSIHRMLYDKDDTPVNYIFQNVNPAFEKLINREAKTIIGKTAFDIFPTTTSGSLKQLDDVVKTGVPAKFELYDPDLNKHFDISAFRTDESRFATLISDITSRKNSEIKQLRLMTAIEQLAESIIITDPKGTIQYINPAFEKITGYSSKEALGQNPNMLASGEQDDSFYKDMWNTIKSGKRWEGQFINSKKNGSTYIEEATISPVTDNNGVITNYVAIKQDVTEAISRDEQLRQAQKMEAIGNLAGGVAHDFNNLLMAIMGYVELCRDELESNHAAREYLTEITSATERSVGITKQLLAFARKQDIAPKIIKLNDAISTILPFLSKMIGENITLQWVPSEKPWSIKMDPGQVDQILANLFVNARDAINDSGEITIETHNVSFDPALYKEKHEGIKRGEYVLLTFSDNGEGMNENTLKNIFEPFFTTKDVGQGTGLGLATIYGIVQQNHGFINVYSEPNVGTTFRIYFPKCEAATNTDSKQKDQKQISGGNETILLVEDEKTILHITQLFLEKQGYNVLKASAPNEAIEKAQEYPSKIDLLLSDIVMPIMNGPQLAEILKEIRPNMKQLFMSGYTANVVSKREMLDENVNFLAKPFSREALADKIRAILENN
ncbi:MAG: response regulator [Kiritimatiellae bacterium]|nr:response regulator [Kiritimatiellia bacterium]